MEQAGSFKYARKSKAPVCSEILLMAAGVGGTWLLVSRSDWIRYSSKTDTNRKNTFKATFFSMNDF